MKTLCIAQCEDRTNLDAQILKQTVQPDRAIFYVDPAPARGINERRTRIADNHRRLQDYVMAYKPDLVWQVEGDGDYPEDCLERLLEDYAMLKEIDGDNFGYVSGIQVGRHGLYCLGAWRDFTYDVYEAAKHADTKNAISSKYLSGFESLDYQLPNLQRVDATGFYCLLAEREVWLSGKARWKGQPYGPDVVWGLSIDKNKYCDMNITVGHKIPSGIIRVEHMSTCNVKFYDTDQGWKYEQL